MASQIPARHADEREAQFDALYEAHRRTLHAYLLGRTSDPELALDLLQEAFVRAWRNLDTLLTLSPPRQRAWLFAISRNLVIDQYRGRAARSTAQDALVAATTADAQAAESAEQAAERERGLRLVDA